MVKEGLEAALMDGVSELVVNGGCDYISNYPHLQVMEGLGEKLTEEELGKMMREADTDGDGQVTRECDWASVTDSSF